MITPEVVAFVKDQDAKGTSREATRALLASQGGWSQENIDEAFAAAPLVFAPPNAQTPNPPPPPPSPAATAEPKKANPFMPILVTAGIVALFLIGAGAVYAFVPSVKHEVQYVFASPEQKVALSLEKLYTVPERYQVTLASETYIEEGDEPIEDGLETLLAQRSASEVTTTIERLEGDTTSLPMRTYGTFTADSTTFGRTTTVRGEVYADPSSMLLKLTDTIDLLFFSTEPITGKWVSLLEGEVTDAAVPIDSELMAHISAGYSVYRDTLAYLAKRAPEYLTVEDTGDVRSVQGEKARKYLVTIKPEELKAVFAESPLVTSDRLPLEARDTFKASLEKVEDTLEGQEPLELWISERTHYPVKWRMVRRENVESLIVSYVRVTESSGTATVSGGIAPIEVPEKDLTINEALTLITEELREIFGT